ncbi:MAG TPA: hypothetical protein VH681_12410 [Nitrospiraceae bacterium]|jgi:hypothetical protein
MMTTVKSPYGQQLRTIAELMLAVAGESVTMMKRNAPQEAMKLKRQVEWKIYLEFLKVMFNLTDRLSALHIPLKDQQEFMNSLEEAVTQQLKAVLEPAFGSQADQTEIMVTISGAVAESQQLYEKYKFLVSEESSQRNELFKDFGERVADVMGVAGNGQVSSAAVLCVSAVIPALTSILVGDAPPTQEGQPKQASSSVSPSPSTTPKGPAGNEIKLVSVMAGITGEEVETRWGLHPRFRQDLNPDEIQQLTKLMNRVAKILGERYASVAFSDEWASWHKAGHA